MNFPGLLTDENCEFEFICQQTEKIKKLAGFQNDRHFLPKYFSKSLVAFVRKISIKDIEERFSPMSERLRDSLGLKLGDYTFDINSIDGGVFECSQLKLSMNYYPDEESLSEVIFSLNLTVTKNHINIIEQVTPLIPYSYQYVKFQIAPDFNLGRFIEQYEEYFTGSENHVKSYYDLNATRFELDFIHSGKKIALTENEIKVYFSNQFSVSEFINDYVGVQSYSQNK